MTDKEKIKAIKDEIKRLYNQSLTDENRQADRGLERAASVSYGKSIACKELLLFTDTLQEEPVSKDLEEAIGKYCSNPDNFITYIDVGFKQSPIKTDDIPLIIKAIEFGANWQKEQMMAKAVDGVVHGSDRLGVVSVHYNAPDGVPMAYYISSEELFEGDEVKIILVKNDK